MSAQCLRQSDSMTFGSLVVWLSQEADNVILDRGATELQFGGKPAGGMLIDDVETLCEQADGVVTSEGRAEIEFNGVVTLKLFGARAQVVRQWQDRQRAVERRQEREQRKLHEQMMANPKYVALEAKAQSILAGIN